MIDYQVFCINSSKGLYTKTLTIVVVMIVTTLQLKNLVARIVEEDINAYISTMVSFAVTTDSDQCWIVLQHT